MRVGSSVAPRASQQPPPPFTHVAGYRLATAAFVGEVDSLLDEASYGSRWVALCPVPVHRGTVRSFPERHYRQSPRAANPERERLVKAE